MDWRERKYYIVNFDWCAYEMRINNLRLIDSVKIYPYKNTEKQPDELNNRGVYQNLISVKIDNCESVEYELNKAIRNDDYCIWKEVKRDTNKKYFDVYGFEMSYRRCEINPNKRCNHCGDCICCINACGYINPLTGYKYSEGYVRAYCKAFYPNTYNKIYNTKS